MRSPEALATALGMLNCPPVTRQARRSPLPKGITFLLEVAAGEDKALRDASALTGQTEATLRKAAGFFIEQVLLGQCTDNYRLLGGSRQSSDANLRRHMALIMRWLHPDVVSNGGPSSNLDRSIYAHRVTEAWEAVKTNERRAAYDASLATDRQKEGIPAAAADKRLFIASAEDTTTIGTRQLTLQPVRRKRFLGRVLLLFAGRS